ncbi:hypothetical protein Cni_G25130 [Canna indica]|uniref:Zinc finger CCCH domain-containing protein 53 n=1 Tax=Canna indica TaxID=4628 RepID=A0AAQ3L0E7_9LILI|nr:hypothetical protein Cni_G25130 [Canna indica]
MDAYEATKVVFSRIQNLDPENAAKIMGLLLLQEHGEKEMIRLAFGPETLLHSVVLKARKELGLSVPGTPSVGGSGGGSASSFLRQNSASRLLSGGLPSPLSVSSPSSWAPPSVFSRSNSSAGGSGLNGSLDELQNSDELISPSNLGASPFYGGGGGGGDLVDEFRLPDQFSFLGDNAAAANSNHALSINSKPGSDLFQYPDIECRSPSGNGDGGLFPYGMGWGVNGYHHRRSCSAADICLSDPAAGFGWKPCLYFARGYCKNGTACRFLHGLPEEAVTAGTKMDAAVEQQCQELLLRSKSRGASQLMASAFPYSPTGSVPPSPSSASSKCLSFLIQQQQQQQNENQRAAAAAAAAALMLGGDDAHKFMGRSRLERSDLISNPGSRQIYLTFPADSTFREEDVSNYFSIYGPVQDVRIPYQQKRMFGFVTFVYPETVKLILAKGNPHFVCDSRVLVKPYKEKGKVPDKKQQQLGERGDFSACTTPTGLDAREVYDLQQLGTRMLYNSSSTTQELLLRRKIEEQQQAAELQRAIELQGRRFMGLHLDLSNRSLSSSAPASINSPTVQATPSISIGDRGSNVSNSSTSSQEESPTEDKCLSASAPEEVNSSQGQDKADKEESTGEAIPNGVGDFQESAEHNLPDSPFASPTKSSFILNSFSTTEDMTSPYVGNNNSSSSNNQQIPSTLLPATSSIDMPSSFSSCFLQMPRHGIQQRKNSWQDGMPGTNCPILPGANFTYKFQVKDQIGSFFYFPSIGMQRAAGGYGGLQVHSRLLIPVPYDEPADEYSVLIGDWYTKSHKVLAKLLDAGRSIGNPNGIVINGRSGKDAKGNDDAPQFTMEAGKTYLYRICNAGLKVTLNFRIQNHQMKLVEMEGSHVVQNDYDSLDVHVGQCLTVLVTADQEPKDYYMVASTRFTKYSRIATGIIRYAGSNTAPSAELPKAPVGWAWSLNQWRSFRWNLTASAARPNPQGSYHYGSINITRTIKLSSSAGLVDGRRRFALNGVSHVEAATPLKLAEYYSITDKVFKYDLIGDEPPSSDAVSTAAPNVLSTPFRNYVEIILENPERSVQSYHLDGYSFFAIGMGHGKWTPESRKTYNLLDAVSRHTIQVYPRSWSAITLTFDNAGMWNLRSELAERRYLGQQLYVSVVSPARSLRDEYNIWDNSLLCGEVVGLPKPPSYV